MWVFFPVAYSHFSKRNKQFRPSAILSSRQVLYFLRPIWYLRNKSCLRVFVTGPFATSSLPRPPPSLSLSCMHSLVRSLNFGFAFLNDGDGVHRRPHPPRPSVRIIFYLSSFLVIAFSVLCGDEVVIGGDTPHAQQLRSNHVFGQS